MGITTSIADVENIILRLLQSAHYDVATKRRFDAQETNYLLSKVEPEDLIQFGMIPEFVGRFNSMANCNELTVEDAVCDICKLDAFPLFVYSTFRIMFSKILENVSSGIG